MADTSFARLALLIAGSLLSGYLALALYAWFGPDHLIYHPEMASTRRVPDAVKLETDDGGSISVLYLPHPNARFTIWVFHGNAEGLGDSEPMLRELQGRGFNVFAYDYPGYGHSDGRPQEKSIYAATRVGLDYLRTTHGVEPSNIIALGRSLGGGPAVELARTVPVAGLILHSTFTSAFRVVTHRKILPFDQYDNLAKLRQVECPILILHGAQDEIVPYAHAVQLHTAASGRSRLLPIEGAGHNNLQDWAGPRYWSAIEEFCRGLK
ncbi:MAG: alpha/beta hydrolase [Opitutaceae bacterium]|nr:alpha/beta hydrolase [Opitutaceae bacterium]